VNADIVKIEIDVSLKNGLNYGSDSVGNYAGVTGVIWPCVQKIRGEQK
jgi:hypothetical protein